jgi:hypothetical protein
MLRQLRESVAVNRERTARRRVQELLKRQLQSFRDADTTRRARAWLAENQQGIETLFNHPVLLDFIFEPLKGVFQVPGEGQEKEARQVITRVALVNAVIAGLPGSLGVGVFVCIGLEFWMAYALSQVVGLRLTRDEAIDTLIGWMIGAGGILYGFKLVLNLVFPVVTAILPFSGLGTALTQLIVTNLFGVVFWILFEELKSGRKFKFPLKSLRRLATETSGLLKHQFAAGAGALDPEKWMLMGGRLWSWMKGEVPTDMPQLRGELASTVMMAWLLSGHLEKLSGPLADEFLEAVRDSISGDVGHSVEEIAKYVTEDIAGKGAEEINGLMSSVKGRLFERLVERYQNDDSDAWEAKLHDDPNYPGSDIVFTNAETGEQVEISLKATDSPAYVENALARYPDFSIITTDEVVESLEDNHLIWAAGITNEELENITTENFEQMLEGLQPVEAMGVVGGGVAAGAIAKLWPYVVAYLRGNIDKAHLVRVCMKVMPESGNALASRLVYAAALGPVFAWWMLARGVFMLTPVNDRDEQKKSERMVLRPA